jgi:hypothetical protein
MTVTIQRVPLTAFLASVPLCCHATCPRTYAVIFAPVTAYLA